MEDFEIWKDIEGFECKYQVSNTGKVRSLNYHRTGMVKELRLAHHKQGYLMANLFKNGENKLITVHRLVATAFLPNPMNLPVINHRDENPSNNHVSNLEWTTQKENLRYSNIGWTPRPVLQFTKDGVLVGEYESMYDAYKQTGVDFSSISACCLGKYKSAGNFIWKYKQI